MKRRIAFGLLALVMLVVLSACGQPKIDDLEVAKQGQTFFTDQPAANPPPESLPVSDLPEGEMDPDQQHAAAMNEEDSMGDLGYDDEVVQAVNTSFAGATPMPLDPIDMPTPPPREKLQFAYNTYENVRLGISFDGPVGWETDEAIENTVVLLEPESQIRDNYRAFLMIEVKGTGATPSKAEMRNQVQGILKTMSGEYAEWRNTNTADRTLMSEDGVYADYRGVQMDGTIVRGRIHIACKDKKLITVHMSCPAEYNEDYTQGMYVKFRNTLKFISK